MKLTLLVLILTIAGVLILSGLVACSDNSGSLENTTWVLDSYGQPGSLKPALKEVEVTALFDSPTSQVTGSASVNRYSGTYRLDGNKLVISGPMASTKMAGPVPLMAQEAEFLSTLQVAESYKMDGSKLTITCGSKVLIFRKQ